MENYLAFGEDDINQIQSAAGLENSPGTLANLISGQEISLTVILFFVAGLLFVFYMISGGISLMTSAGDPKAVAEAKQKITNAFIGLLIVIGAYWIVQLAGFVLRLPGIEATF